jgi:hypothetical protein
LSSVSLSMGIGFGPTPALRTDRVMDQAEDAVSRSVSPANSWVGTGCGLTLLLFNTTSTQSARSCTPGFAVQTRTTVASAVPTLGMSSYIVCTDI